MRRRIINKAGIVGVDIKLAFDSVSHSYLEEVLKAFGWPVNIREWIKTLYNGAESAIMNGGLTTKYFPLERSCRQGDALSPYLFIMAIEPLIIQIRKLQGITLHRGVYQVGAFADDLNVGIGSMEDIRKLEGILEEYHKASGLQVNKEKSELPTTHWEMEQAG